MKSKIDAFRRIQKMYGTRMAVKAMKTSLSGGNAADILPRPPEPERLEEPAPIVAPNYFDWHREWLENHDLTTSSTPRPSRIFKQPNVAIIADLYLAQCKKFRVMQKVEAFNHAGIKSSFCHWADQPRSLLNMQTATHLIFYRMTNTDIMQAYINEARRLGLAIIYDIDDPLFDLDVYSMNTGLDYISKSEKRHLLSECDNYIAAMEQCDYFISSTPELQDLMTERFSKPVLLWRNLVDADAMLSADIVLSENVEPAEAFDPDASEAAPITIGYMSGSRSHQANFLTAETALVKAFETYPNLQMKVVGFLDIPESLEPYAAQIEMVPFSNYADYLRELSSVDFNIVPLVRDKFNGCKSAIRYLDAAMVKVPSVATYVGDFINVVSDGKTGFLAKSEDDFFDMIVKYIESPALRKRHGDAARKDVLNRFALRDVPAPFLKLMAST